MGSGARTRVPRQVPEQELAVVGGGCKEWCFAGSASGPREGIDRCAVGVELHNGLPRTAHVEDLHVLPILVERGHVVRVCGVERYAQEWGCWGTCGGAWGTWCGTTLCLHSRASGGLWWWGFVEDGAVFEGTKVKGAKRTIRADGDEDICRVWEPCNVVYLAVVRDKLRDRGRCVDIPDSARRVD